MMMYEMDHIPRKVRRISIMISKMHSIHCSKIWDNLHLRRHRTPFNLRLLNQGGTRREMIQRKMMQREGAGKRRSELEKRREDGGERKNEGAKRKRNGKRNVKKIVIYRSLVIVMKSLRLNE